MNIKALLLACVLIGFSTLTNVLGGTARAADVAVPAASGHTYNLTKQQTYDAVIATMRRIGLPFGSSDLSAGVITSNAVGHFGRVTGTDFNLEVLSPTSTAVTIQRYTMSGLRPRSIVTDQAADAAFFAALDALTAERKQP